MKRGALFRTIGILLAALLAAIGVYSTRVAPRWLRTSRLVVRVPGLPDDWDGVRISHLSDFHLGAKFMTTDHLHQARKIALDYKPDLLALTGDFYDNGWRVSSEGLYCDWPESLPVLAVLGNHDRRGPGTPVEMTRKELQRANVTVLDNESTALCLRGREAWIVGVDDPHTFNSDVQLAFSDVPDGVTPLLFLSHSPTVICDMEPGRASILLAGHTHGGQIRLLPSGRVPMIELIRNICRSPERPDGPVYRRWHWINGTIVLISDGLGVSTLPIRFRTRPHVILIELRRAPGHDDRACDDVDRYVEEVDAEPWLLRWLT